MTFGILDFTILVCGLWVKASWASEAGSAAYTTIANTIDIKGAVESIQENNSRGSGGQNVYAANDDPEMISISDMSKVSSGHLISSDAPSSSKSMLLMHSHKLPLNSETPDIVTGSGISISHVATSSGPSISISATGPNIRTISYSAPGRIFLSHGSPGSFYVSSTHHSSPSLSASPLHYSGRNPADSNYYAYVANSSPTKYNLPEFAAPSSSSSSSSPLGFQYSQMPADFGNPSKRKYSVYTGPNSRLVIFGGLDSRSTIDHISADPDALAKVRSTFGKVDHPVYAEAYRNIQATRQLVDGISSAVSRAVNINLAGIGAG